VQRSGFLGFDYDLNDTTTIWGHSLLGRIQSYQANAGNPELQGIWHIRYSPDNPFLPELLRNAMIAEGRDFVEVHMNGFMSDRYGGGETNINVHNMWSLTAGATMDLPNGWTLRGSYQYGESGNRTEGRGWERMDRVYMGLDTVTADPETGEILEPGAEGGVSMCRVQAVARQFELQNRDLEAELHEWAQENTLENRHDAGAHPEGDPIPIDFPFAVDSVDNSIRDCVPFNLLGLNNASREAVDYVRGTDKVGLSDADQHFVEVMATGTLWQGWGAGSIETAVGATYREESVGRWIRPDLLDVDALGPPVNVAVPLDLNDPDGEQLIVVQGIPGGYEGGSPNLHNFSTFPTYSGGFDVWELFNETIVPLYTAPGGEQRVELNLAGRYADYSRAGGHWTYKGGLDFRVTNDLRLRGTYSRDFREATFSEMFDQQGGGGSVNDPEFDGTSFPITSISGGNPDLEPEVAYTTVAGFVYQPSFVPGLSFSADWFNVDQRQRIGSLGTSFIVNQCFDEGVHCERVIRDDDGVIQRIFNVNINVDFAKLEGIDMELSYRMQPNFFSGLTESFSVRLLGNRLLHFSTYQAGQNRDEQNTAGSGGRPHWQTTASLNYRVGAFGIRWNQNWSSGVKRSRFWVDGDHVARNRWPSQSSESMGLSYNFDTEAGSWCTGLNINNPFNRKPMHTPGFSQRGGVGAGSRGDSIGRRYSFNMRYSY
jgi:iron complex outermembrane recepter protein